MDAVNEFLLFLDGFLGSASWFPYFLLAVGIFFTLFFIHIGFDFGDWQSIGQLARNDQVGPAVEAFLDRDEFMQRIRRTYALMGCFVVLHLLPGFQLPDGSLYLRVAGAVALFSTAIFRKEWLVYVVGIVWLVGLVQRLVAG